MIERADSGLHRSVRDRRFLGVCGGLADYFGIDAALFRLAFVLLFFSGPGFLAYFAAAAVMPSEGRRALSPAPRRAITPRSDLREAALDAWPAFAPGWRQARRRYRIGAALVLIGVLFLAANLNLLVWLNWSMIWPLALIVLGILLLRRQIYR